MSWKAVKKRLVSLLGNASKDSFNCESRCLSGRGNPEVMCVVPTDWDSRSRSTSGPSELNE